jgi:hypothetical protein
VTNPGIIATWESFEKFKSTVAIIIGIKSDAIRRTFLRTFIDTDGEYFQNHIGYDHLKSSELPYDGYYWEVFRNPAIIHESQLYDPSRYNGRIYVLWDIHSASKVMESDYWRFPKTAILETTYENALAGRRFLPRDVYLVDHEFDWVIALTHETHLDGRDYIVLQGKL